MGRKEGVHEGLKVWSPPLRQSIADLPFPFIDTIAAELGPHRSQAFVETLFEAGDLVGIFREVVTRSAQLQSVWFQIEDCRMKWHLTI